MENTLLKGRLRILAAAAIGCLALGGLSAQELKFDGYINSGIGIVSTNTQVNDNEGNKKTADTKVFAYKNNGTDTDNFSVFAIRPSVAFNFDSKTFVEIGDLIAIANGPEGAFGDAGDSKKASNLSNVFYIDFKWSF
jgi:maltoporin